MKKMLILGLLPLLMPSAISALTINEALVHVINTNPEIHERIENHKAIEKDKTIAFADYLVVVDIQGGVGKKRYNGTIPGFDDDEWTHTEAFIRARENIFHGFGTESNVEQQDKRLESAKHYLMEKVSQLGLDMIEKYLSILKTKKLLKLAVENRDKHNEYYNKIKQNTESGAGTSADMAQISGRLALAESNVWVAKNNLLDAQTNFYRIYGEMVTPSDLTEPKIDSNFIPKTLKEAEQLALDDYPSILTMKKNVEALKAKYKQTKENYYPWVDLELKQNYYNNNNSGTLAGLDFAREVSQTTLMLIATWNLYNGGADVALREKAAIRMFEESDRMLNTVRLVKERLELSWAAKERLAEQVKYLKQHRDYTKKTVADYNEEFGLGRRTLLDLLDVENEFYTSRKAYVTGLYDEKLAKFRLIENVGNLPKMVSVTPEDILQIERIAR